jgi:hypothetical protein
VSKHDLVGREPREANAAEPREPAAGAPVPSGRVHDLSVPGGRPLCGADAVMDPPPRSTAPVTCPSCARLLDEDAQRRAHAARPQAEESED